MKKIYVDDTYQNEFGDCSTFKELAEAVKRQTFYNTVIFIFINFKFKGSRRQTQSGIELLIWLRLIDIMNHCVLCSFETTHALLNRKPEYLVATSNGTSFIQLPKVIKEINTTVLENKKAEPENLKQTLIATFNNIGVKHRLANIYGLWFLFNIHNKYFPKTRLKQSIFQAEFYNDFDELQLSISEYLVNKTHAQETPASLVTKIELISKKLMNRNPRILYIDDKADLGWGVLIKRMLFQNSPNTDFQIHIPKKSDFNSRADFDLLTNTIRDKIYNYGKFIDCLLLDLRLADEEGEIDNLDSLSGVRLLKAIRKFHPSLPVIMTTASNKAKSIKKVIDIGAEGLWTKPGLDEIKEDEFYLQYYLELLSYVESAATKYTTNVEKHIVKTEFELSQLKPNQYIPKQFSSIDVILTDTTIWAEQGKSLVQNHKSLYLLTSGKGKFGKRFIVIDDVLAELFIHSKNDAAKPLQRSCTFSIARIQQYKELNWIGSGFNEVATAIQEATDYKVEDAGNGAFLVISTVSKIHSYYQNEVTAKKEAQKKIANKSKALHADDTFKMLISYFLEVGKNILFIANDTGCRDEILKTLQYKFGAVTDNYALPTAFNKENDVLKMNHKLKNYCLIITGNVMNNICLPRRGNTVNTFELPSPNIP